MNFVLPTPLWPSMLWLMLLVPILAILYIWMTGRRRKTAIQYAGLQSVGKPAGALRRHLPALLMLLAIASMIFAMSRPVALITLPARHNTIVLAMDISGSMRAGDVEPSRIDAAKAAARQFIDDVPATTRVALVTFAGTAALIQAPTDSREALHEALDRMELQRGTAIGSGMVLSLKALFPKEKFDLRADRRANNRGLALPGRSDNRFDADSPEKPADSVEPGSIKSMAVILLSDGQTTTGPDPKKAAELAAKRGIRIFTVGFGTAEGAVIASDGWKMRVKLDEPTLQQIAQDTRAEYFLAQTADELNNVYDNLTSKLVFERKRTEVSSLFAALGALLSLISAALSMIWFNRIF